MNCNKCNAELNAEDKLCPSCGIVVEGERKNHHKIKLWVLSSAITGVALFLVILLIYIFSKDHSGPLPQQAANPQNLFYLKENGLYHTFVDDINPNKIVDKFYDDKHQPGPIFVSGDSNWLFYPDHPGQSSDVYSYHLSSDQKERSKVTESADIFTTNEDASRFYYLSNHNLYAGYGSMFQKVDTHVDRYFTNNECNWAFYYTSDSTLYQVKEDNVSHKIADKVSMNFVSRDLKTVYYSQDTTMYLVKDGNAPVEIHNGTPRILYAYANGDIFYISGSGLYYCSDGISTQVCNNYYYAWGNFDDTYLYPYRVLYCGTRKPIIMFDDNSHNHYICNGSRVLKKIIGGYIGAVVVNPSDDGLYYVALKNEMDRDGNLFYVSINGTTASDSKRIAIGVSIMGNIYRGGNFVYYKNVTESILGGIGDMYIDEKKIDTGVLANTWINEALINPNTFIYNTNSKEYYNNNDRNFYSNDTIMLYQDGVTKKIGDNIIDYEIYGDKIVYLSIDDPDADSGTLHLYELNGKDSVIDTNVGAIFRPKSDRVEGGEINPRSRVPDPC